MDSIAESINKLGDKNTRVRQRAEKELIKIGKPSVEPLIHTLEDENWRARWSAAEDLGHIGGVNKKAELIIRAALGNAEDNTREDAAHALEIMIEEREHEILYSKNWEG